MSLPSVEEFYAGMCPHYHLFFEDWDASVARQGRALDDIIAAALGEGPRTILDAACGIGTQALGLALCGHEVCGTDVSAPAIARATEEAARLGVALETQVADMRHLTSVLDDRFEVVAVLDNAFAHFLDQAELLAAVRELCAMVAPGGLLMASIRDYDRLIKERPGSTPPLVFEEAGGRRIVFQIWDWREGDRYDLTQYLVRHRADGLETVAFGTPLRAVTRAALSAALCDAGLEELRWWEPETSGFYQPIVTARAA